MNESGAPPIEAAGATGSTRSQREFARSFDSLDAVFAFVQPLLEAHHVGEADAYAISMAIEELFTNMVKYNAAGDGRIGIEIECGGEEVACRLTDPDSERFDVTQAPEVDIRRPVAQRHSGGLGIHLVRRLVDSLDYEYAGRRSRISFRRRRDAGGALREPVAPAAGAPGEQALKSPSASGSGAGQMFEIGYGEGGTIALSGRLDAAQCDKAQAFIDAARAAGVFDFRSLEYISSAGLGVLLRVHKRLAASGGRLRLVNVNSHIYDIFRFSGFDQVFDVERA